MQRNSTLLAVALAALGAVSFAPVAQAAPTCQVQNARTHAKYTTLQAAVEAASPGDVLKVKHTCVGDTTVTKNLTITGQGPATLNGGNNELNPGFVVTVNEEVTVAISGLTITGGYAIFGVGGGISAHGEAPVVTLLNSTVAGNAGSGINFERQGEVRLTNSTVEGNTDWGIQAKQGVFSSAATLLNSTVADNGAHGKGGGIWAGAALLTDSTVRGNGGSGVRVTEGRAIVTDSTVSDNTGVGVGGSECGITLSDSTVSGNTGGGVHGIECDITLTDSTVTGNTAEQGGGLRGDRVTLTNSTVTGNKALDGGGILSGKAPFTNESWLTLNDSTVAHNAAEYGGGIDNYTSLTLSGSSSVRKNTATVRGGGIYNHESEGATITFGTGWTGAVSGNEPDDIFNE